MTQKSNEELYKSIEVYIRDLNRHRYADNVKDQSLEYMTVNVVNDLAKLIMSLEERVQELEKKTEIGYMVNKPVENGKENK